LITQEQNSNFSAAQLAGACHTLTGTGIQSMTVEFGDNEYFSHSISCALMA
jgi:hypothetical protein